jgi:membrane protease YdiL (CAAX protease family)
MRPFVKREFLWGVLCGMIVPVAGAAWAMLHGGSVGIADSVSANLVLGAFALVVQLPLNSLREELFSRGYVIAILRRRSLPYAVVASAGLFAALHFVTAPFAPDRSLSLSLAGIAYALLWVRTGSLWAPIGAHTAWNLTTV